MSAELERLLSGGDVARRLGLSLQRVHQLREQPDFPQPIGRLGNYHVWRAADIERWMKRTGRAPKSAPRTRRTGPTQRSGA